MDNSLLLIDPTVATVFEEQKRAEQQPPYQPESGSGGVREVPPKGGINTSGSHVPPVSPEQPMPPPTSTAKKHFYGSIELEPVRAKLQFNDLVDEVIGNFTAKPGIRVKIAIEIEAESDANFDDSLQRAVKENCNVLKFKTAEFDE